MALARPIEPITAPTRNSEPRSRTPTCRRCCRRWPTSPVTSRCCARSCASTQCCMVEEQGGLTEEQQAAIRRSPSTLARFRDGGSVDRLATHDRATSTGSSSSSPAACRCDDYLPMMRRGAGPHGATSAPRTGARRTSTPTGRSTSPSSAPACPASSPPTASQQAGVPYVVIDKNPDVGGTWLENTYPGCRVDIPNHYYSYSFAPARRLAALLLARARSCTATSASASTSSASATTSASAPRSPRSCATSDTAHVDAGAARRRRRARTRSRPTPSSAPSASSTGRSCRASRAATASPGPAFHSAEWDHGVDLTGKRVGVIGTGCSAAQFAPIIAEQVGARSRSSSARRTGCSRCRTTTRRCRDGFQWLLRHVPYYRQWYRFWLFWRERRDAAADGRGRPGRGPTRIGRSAS